MYQPFKFALLAAALVSVQASPLVARVDGNVKFCVDILGLGNCQVDAFNNGDCFDFLTSAKDFNDKVSTFQPDIGVTCTVFQDSGCSGNSLALSFPGSTDLRVQNFNDIMSSFRCDRWTFGLC
ncbi:hypothetical protein R3P38DRAFT_1553270 [Favolaschia claudopus]|uniref:Uncharacterized protein n=1 Tax=Favolaschia claudopus TaxID=2862362 RepID=A0AAW0AIF5_9AGAR